MTRPEREAAWWVEVLRQRGVSAHPLPLIAIGAAPDPAALASCRADLGAYRAAMFVSANAVQGFLEVAGAAWPGSTRAWATGPGTARALLAAGVPASRIDVPGPQSPQFDSETLWALVGAGVLPGDRVLIVRGGDAKGLPAGRDWLASRLEEAGAHVDTAVAYVRAIPRWSPGQHAQALAGAGDGAWWLFSSSEGVDNLGILLPGQLWSRARALCTHPRIAQAARAAGFGQVAVSRPELEEVLAFLQSSP